MRIAILSAGLVLAIAAYGCGGSSGSCTTGCGGAGGGAGKVGGGGAGSGGAAGSAAGGGGRAGQDGGSAGAGGLAGGGGAGGAVGGNGGGVAGAGGLAGGGGAGGSACGEPASCEGFDNSPDAHLTAEITCLSPSSAAANSAFTFAVFGRHLATGASDYAIVTVGGVPVNGVPASACHLDVAVPANTISAGQVPVVVSPGGRIQASAAATLTVH